MTPDICDYVGQSAGARGRRCILPAGHDGGHHDHESLAKQRLNEMIGDGLQSRTYEPGPDGTWQCPQCAALTVDPARHDVWHQTLGFAVQLLQQQNAAR